MTSLSNVASGDPKSGPQGCTISTLPAEPHPAPSSLATLSALPILRTVDSQGASGYFPAWTSEMVPAEAKVSQGQLPTSVGGFLPEATMHGLLNLYCAMQRGLVDAKAR